MSFVEDKEPLPWNTRVQIAIGIAEALCFLRRTQNQVDNRPLRLHNILLDTEFNAKLSDFEAAKLVHGNSYSGYTSQIGSLQVKGNVHAFGVILVQILTGQHISKVDFANLRQTLNLKQESKESFMRALDPRLHSLNDATVKQALKMAALAFLCLDEPSYTLNQALDILRQL
ncbi:probable serine/threonine-protein kinase PBL11 [Helianthus annuus]|uniref:probable serine/threonine-protein kinase PBL11 n=1 Tax=Helianthus annuus TaxID=4232 RepID=UPI000B8FF9AD|nr:probable serine/threonine-protein kinase PBL11 [Helianthus annuus]